MSSSFSNPIGAGPVLYTAGPDAAATKRLHLGARGATGARRSGLEPTVGDRVHEPSFEVGPYEIFPYLCSNNNGARYR